MSIPAIKLVQDKYYGWLPILLDNGIEIYRGEYRRFPHEALDKAIEAIGRLKIEASEDRNE